MTYSPSERSVPGGVPGCPRPAKSHPNERISPRRSASTDRKRVEGNRRRVATATTVESLPLQLQKGIGFGSAILAEPSNCAVSHVRMLREQKRQPGRGSVRFGKASRAAPDTRAEWDYLEPPVWAV